MSSRRPESLPPDTSPRPCGPDAKGPTTMPTITPWLWFDTEGEQAAEFYTSIFPNSRITHVARYGNAGPRPAGMVMTVSFELDGQRLAALNGGSQFTFNEAISLQVDCRDQDEVDY